MDLWAPAAEDTYEGTEDGEVVKEFIVDAALEVTDEVDEVEEVDEVATLELEVVVTATLVDPGITINKCLKYWTKMTILANK